MEFVPFTGKLSCGVYIISGGSLKEKYKNKFQKKNIDLH
jgi:hypothetical protein